MTTKRLMVSVLLMFGSVISFVSTALAQGLLVNEAATPAQLPRYAASSDIRRPHPPIHPPRPIPPSRPMLSYAITDITVDAAVKDQVATVNVSQTFKNTGSAQMEVSFVFPLPYDGAIDSLTLLVDGKEFPGKLQSAVEARKTYEEIVRRNQDPALLEWMGTGMFKTSVFPVPPGASRTVTLQYTQLLRVDGGVTDFLFPLSTAKYTAGPVEKIAVNLSIESTAGEIRNVYSPTDTVKIERPAPNRATVAFEQKHTVPQGDFRLLFDSGTGEVGTRLLSYRKDGKDDGFFMLLASPKIADESRKPLPKTVLLVIDRSSSMAGNKIVQAREALKFVLKNLNEGDSFNIIPYDSRVETFKPEIVPVNDATKAEALAYAETIRQTGATNIDEALKVSLGMLKKEEGPAYVIFLTDGCPTVGERNEMKLAETARKANTYGARVFTFGVGHDVNSRLLDRLARDSRGQTVFVSPQEDIEAGVGKLYNRISAPVLTDVAFEIAVDDKSHATNRVFPGGRFDLFSGEQLVLVGRYSKSGAATITVRGKDGETEKTFTFEGELVAESRDGTHSYIERLWAIRRIGEIIDELDLKGENKELVDELVRLSTQHGVLTPYTSFLADETTDVTAFSSNAMQTRRNTEMLRETIGSNAFGQRGFKREMQFADNLGAPASARDSMELAKDATPARPGAPPTSNAPMRSSGFGGGFNQAAPGLHSNALGGKPRQAPMGSGFQGQQPDAGMPAQNAVRNINNRAFYQRSEAWIDSTLNEEQQKPENIVTVKQFGEEYFKLIDRYGKDFAQYLVFDEPVLVRYDNQTFRIEP